MIKKIVMGIVAMMSLAVRSEVISSCDSAPIAIDSRKGIKYLNPTNQSYSIEWNAAWVGENESAEVVIVDNGTEIKRATGGGAFDYAIKDYGPHVLTYTTYIGGVAQEEVYTATFNAINCEGMGVPGLQRTTFTGSAYDLSHVALGAEPIVTLDGEGMYDSNIAEYTTYLYSGFMYFRANETYTFRAHFDDLKINNQCVEKLLVFYRSCGKTC